MSWLAILGIAVLVTAVVTVFRAAPKGGRPAGRTSLMSAARVVLAILGAILLYLGLRR